MTDARSTGFPPLVVGADSEVVRRTGRAQLIFMVVNVVMTGFVAAMIAALVASTNDFGTGLLAASPFLLMLAFVVMLTAYAALTAGRREATGTTLTLDAAGLSSTIPEGRIFLPWQAIHALEVRKRGRHRIAIFRLLPGVAPDSPGVQTTLAPRVFGVLVKKGFRVGSAGIDVPVQTVLDASAAFTAGRLIAR